MRESLHSKKGVYLTEGAFSGGDRTVQDYRISNVRIGANPEGFDRVVIDVVGNLQGEKSIIARPPLFHVENTGKSKRTVITLFGKPKMEFSTSSAFAQAKKTASIQGIEFLPLIEDDRWTFSLLTKENTKVEAFELTQPARIIIDIKK